MKTVLIFIAISLFFLGNSTATNNLHEGKSWEMLSQPTFLDKTVTVQEVKDKECKINDSLTYLDSLFVLLNQGVERRGCCSWHGGICDCWLGRVVCCNGTLSPSCGC
jgi:hypothetical protein